MGKNRLLPSVLPGMIVLAVLAHGAVADPPVISYVTQPVRHWETFFIFGEGLRGKDVKVLRGEIVDPRSPEECVRAMLEGETFTPPAEPPEDVGDLYGRQYAMGPQVIGGKLQGGVEVLWVRRGKEVSPPYVVNRPEVFFVEFDCVAPGQECRVFGRNMVQSFYPPQPAIFLLDRPGKRQFRCQWGNRYDYQDHLNYQLPYELRFKVPDAVPDGTYELWVHNGLKTGLHGFGGPVTLTVKRAKPARPKTFPVGRFGAKGDGQTDDTASLEKAVTAAVEAGGGVVYFAPGDYLLSRPLRVPPGVDLRGMRPGDCRLIVRPGAVPFSKTLSNEPPIGGGVDWRRIAGLLREPPMVCLVSRSRVEDLTLLAEEPVYWAVAAAAPDGDVEHVAIRNCTVVNTHAPWISGSWRPGTGCIGILGHARACEIRDCRLRGINGIRHDGTGTRCRTIGNRFRPTSGPFGTTGMGWMIGVHCIVEGNLCEESNRGFTCGPWKGPIRQNFIARNGVINGGSVGGAGESFLFEGPDVGLETWFGTPSGTGPDWLEQADRKWKPGTLRGRVALVVYGRGFGQWRRVRDNTESRVVLAEPWSVVPDRTSLIVVRQFFVQNVLLNNYCRDAVGGIEFYGAALENTVERFVSRRAGPVLWYGAHLADPARRMPFGPSWYNEARRCRLLECRGVVLDAGRRTDMLTPAPLLVGNRVHQSEFRHSPYVTESRMLLGLKRTSWLPYGDPRRNAPAPAVAYNILDSSRFDLYPGERGVVLAPETTGTLLWQLRFSGEKPHVQDRATATTVVPQ